MKSFFEDPRMDVMAIGVEDVITASVDPDNPPAGTTDPYEGDLDM